MSLKSVIIKDMENLHRKFHDINNNKSFLNIKYRKSISDPLKNSWAFDNHKRNMERYLMERKNKSKRPNYIKKEAENKIMSLDEIFELQTKK